MTVRNIKKNLAGMQDLLIGKGTETQNRADALYSINRIDVPFAVDTITEMQDLDIALFTRARVYNTETEFTDYIYDPALATGITSNTGAGTWASVAKQRPYATVAEALADPSARLGQYFQCMDYATGNNAGVLHFKWVAAGTGTPDGGSYIDHDTLSLQAEQIFGDTISVKQFGATGSGDEVQILRNIIATGLTVLVDVPMSVNIANNAVDALQPLDNQIIGFSGAGSITVLGQSTASGYSVFYLNGSTGVKLIRPKLIGDKYTHTVTTTEIGNGITCLNTVDCVIFEPNLTKFHADGIRVEGDTNLNIIRAVCDDNRRQGISIISGTDVLVDSPVLKNTRSDNVGTTPLSGGPHAGIDIEPNGNSDVLHGIKIINPVTENNQGSGIIVQLGALMSGRTTHDYVDISIIGHKDKGSATGARASCKFLPGAGGSLSGSVRFIDPHYEMSNLAGFSQQSYSIQAPHVHLVRPVVKDWGQTSSSDKYASPITIYNETSSPGTGSIGNITIERPSFIDTGAAGGGTRLIYAKDDNDIIAGVDGVNIVDTVEVIGSNNTLTLAGTGYLSDSYNNMPVTVTTTGSVIKDSINPVEISSAGTIAVAIQEAVPFSPLRKFTNKSATGVSVRVDCPDAGTTKVDRFIWNGSTGNRMTTTQTESYLVVKSVGNDEFVIVEAVGSWALSLV